MTVVTWLAVSSAWASLKRTPFWAPLPVPTMMAVGVASPRAQGQAMTSTEMNTWRAKPASFPASSQRRAATAAMAITTGTNTPATLSASRAMGALEPWASSTSLMIWARAVSRPIRSARTRRKPPWLMVAPVTLSPGALSTGMLSPVSMLSSTEDPPSVGTLAPGFTSRMSPTFTCSRGISRSAPSRSTRAVLGERAIRRLMDSPVRPLERSSIVLPSSTRAMIIEALSK